MEFVELCMQFVLFQACQLTQTHVHNLACLNLVEVESSHQVVHRFLWTLGCTYDVYHLVDVVAGNDETFEDV